MRYLLILVLALLTSSAFAQMNWYAKTARTAEKNATVVWDTTYLNQQRPDVWKGWIKNESTDTLSYCTDLDSLNIQRLYPGEVESGVLIYGRMLNVRTDGTSSKYRAKFN